MESLINTIPLQVKDSIINDALALGMLVEVCSKCGKLVNLESATFERKKFEKCSCGALPDLRWNSRLMGLWEKEVADVIVDKPVVQEKTDICNDIPTQKTGSLET